MYSLADMALPLVLARFILWASAPAKSAAVKWILTGRRQKRNHQEKNNS
jgi:hypothetical protein